MQETAATGAAFQYISRIIILLSGIVFYAFLMHTFSTIFVGALVLVSTVVQILAGLFSLRLNNAFMHFLSFDIKNQDTVISLSKKFLKIVVLLTVISVPTMYVISPQLSEFFFHNESDLFLLRISSLYLAVSVAFGLVSALIYGLQRFRKVSMVRMFSAVGGYLVAGIFVLFKGSVESVILGLIVGQVVSLIMLLYRAPFFSKPKHRTPANVSLREVIVYSAPLTLTVFIGNSANAVDKLVVASLMTVSYVGIYNLALMVSTGLFGAFQSINQILLPKLSEIYSQGNSKALNDAIEKAVRMLMVIYLPACLGLISVSSQVTVLIGGIGYVGSLLPLQVILFVTAVFSPVMVISTIPSAIRKTKIAYLSAPLSLVTNLGLSILLIPRLGIMGAAIGFAALYPVRFYISYLYSKQWIHLKIHFLSFFRTWASAGIMALIIGYLGIFSNYDPISLLYLVPVGIGIYLFMIKLAGVIPRGDMETFMGVIPTRMERLRHVILSIAR